MANCSSLYHSGIKNCCSLTTAVKRFVCRKVLHSFNSFCSWFQVTPTCGQATLSVLISSDHLPGGEFLSVSQWMPHRDGPVQIVRTREGAEHLLLLVFPPTPVAHYSIPSSLALCFHLCLGLGKQFHKLPKLACYHLEWHLPVSRADRDPWSSANKRRRTLFHAK